MAHLVVTCHSYSHQLNQYIFACIFGYLQKEPYIFTYSYKYIYVFNAEF